LKLFRHLHMKIKLTHLFTLIFSLTLILPIQAQEKNKLTNDKVIKMIKAELPESTIILAIEADPEDLDTSVDALIALKVGGASKAVLDAIAGAKNKKTEAAATAPVVTSEVPSFNEVVLVNGDSRTKLMQGGEMKVSTNPFSGSKVRQVFNGAQSPTRVKAGDITFELFLMSNMRPEETVFLVRPVQGKRDRRVETMRMSGFMVIRNSSGNKELVPVKYEKIGEANMPGMTAQKYRLTPETKLAPGEYVVMANHQFFDFGVDE